MANAVVLVSCPDQPGIVAAVADLVHLHGGNIVDLQQHTDRVDHTFFQRVEVELDTFDLARDEFVVALGPIARRYAMNLQVRFTDEIPRVAVLASREPHCLHDLLNRWRTGELKVDVRAVIANHPDHAEMASWYGVPYHHLPVQAGEREAQEAAVRDLLRAEGVELIVLARYMQILSAEFCAEYVGQIINIHHSFLPAFMGAKPYHQAHDRGVKIIGVTAHYATADLDDGPIIEQDVVRVSHRDDVEALRAKGRDLEVAVLARAVRAQVEHRVLVCGRRTVVFD